MAKTFEQWVIESGMTGYDYAVVMIGGRKYLLAHVPDSHQQRSGREMAAAFAATCKDDDKVEKDRAKI